MEYVFVVQPKLSLNVFDDYAPMLGHPEPRVFGNWNAMVSYCYQYLMQLAKEGHLRLDRIELLRAALIEGAMDYSECFVIEDYLEVTRVPIRIDGTFWNLDKAI